jgi:hypothetical protein
MTRRWRFGAIRWHTGDGQGELQDDGGEDHQEPSRDLPADGMYVSAFNADTDHKEGATYLWSLKELAALLTPEELSRFREVYEISSRRQLRGAEPPGQKE